MAEPKPNLIVVMSDTLRAPNLGCYGSRDTRTPSMDAFAAQAVVFDAAYSESLPTIPVRRALHTGRRAYPFRDYRPLPWDIVYLPGWQPMDDAEDTLAEQLVGADYHTGLVTDTLPYFAPGMNFTRGFFQWEYVRGQQQDRWRSPRAVTAAQMQRFPCELLSNWYTRNALRYHVANTAEVMSEEDTSTAQVFRWAMRFLEDNRNAQPFYLLVDAFAPHEPWDPPRSYLQMYADPDAGPAVPFLPYAKERGGLAPELVERAVAGYRGLVSLVDTWFGRLMETLERLELAENTVVALISDHGTNFRENCDDVVGKPSFALFPAVMQIPLIIRAPRVAGGRRVPEFVYNHDLVATLYDYGGAVSERGLDGRSLRPLLKGDAGWQPRPYLTSRYGDYLWYRDDEWWLVYGIEGELPYAFHLAADGACRDNRAPDCPAAVRARGWQRLLDDAGGDLPHANQELTDAVGRPLREWAARQKAKG
ncbi:MAG TPA: sulfatase [Armatimonadota bacterium]|nr:sulfatase [Armatimonadota bacterium]